jgi:hypothetical protein
MLLGEKSGIVTTNDKLWLDIFLQLNWCDAVKNILDFEDCYISNVLTKNNFLKIMFLIQHSMLQKQYNVTGTWKAKLL